jgi:hypothetical protein
MNTVWSNAFWSACLIAMTVALAACSEAGVQPEPFTSQELKHEEGTRLIYRLTEYVDGEETSSEEETLTVYRRRLVDGRVELDMEDSSLWYVKNGVFKWVFPYGDTLTIGMVPAPAGRWPQPVDSIPRTVANGQVEDWWYMIYTTVSRDTTIVNAAGTFRSTVTRMHLENADGTVVEEFGSARYTYAPGTGLIRMQVFGLANVDGNILPGERRAELIKILK